MKTYKRFTCFCGAKGNNIKGHANFWAEGSCPVCNSDLGVNSIDRTFDFLRLEEAEAGTDTSYLDALERAHKAPEAYSGPKTEPFSRTMDEDEANFINSFGD